MRSTALLCGFIAPLTSASLLPSNSLHKHCTLSRQYLLTNHSPPPCSFPLLFAVTFYAWCNTQQQKPNQSETDQDLLYRQRIGKQNVLNADTQPPALNVSTETKGTLVASDRLFSHVASIMIVQFHLELDPPIPLHHKDPIKTGFGCVTGWMGLDGWIQAPTENGHLAPYPSRLRPSVSSTIPNTFFLLEFFQIVCQVRTRKRRSNERSASCSGGMGGDLLLPVVEDRGILRQR